MADHIVRPIIRSIVRPIIRALTAPAGSGASINPDAVTLLSKLISWHEFEDTTDDGWGVFPLTLDQSGLTYANASVGGSGPSGRALSAGRASTISTFPGLISTSHTTIFALVSAPAFNSNDPVCGITEDNTSSSSVGFISEASAASAQWLVAGQQVGNTTTGSVSTAGSQAVDSWHLIGYSSRSSNTAYLHYDATRRYASAATGALLTPKKLVVGNSVAGTSSRIAFTGTMLGEPTDAEWTYLYNGGAGRTLTGILSDADYSLPACRMTASYPAVADFQTSYNGLMMAHKGAATTNYARMCNTSRSSGARWFAVQVFTQQVTSAGDTLVSIGLSTADAANRVFYRIAGSINGQVNVTGAAFTDGTDPLTAVAAPGDWFMVAVKNNKIYVGKNNVWSGDLVAETGFAASYTGTLDLLPTVIATAINLSCKIAFVTAEMPYSNPTGFTPWGDP